ncbi:hypothetical protein [Paenibacillus albus]|uniref:hypothetical protein n=1 Tax=Paenibacillus albus TaxID=2495582 RepID=UPI001D131640|nr:hypothetical protein [Paenibacillus albus]
MNEPIAGSRKSAQAAWSDSRKWKLIFGIKLLLNLALAGIFYFDYSIELFWRVSFIFFSVLAFLFVNYFYLNRHRRRNVLFHLLILDFVISAAYGYIYVGGASRIISS